MRNVQKIGQAKRPLLATPQPDNRPAHGDRGEKKSSRKARAQTLETEFKEVRKSLWAALQLSRR
jgi:hypothetical protein